VQVATGRPLETVHLIDWEQPEKNDFALAEEVTLKGGYERRPDVVLYVNGLAVAVIELKRSSVEIADGVRQLITNQEEIFNLPFFVAAQLLLAGSDSQGLRFGTATTREEFFAGWKTAPLPAGAPVVAGALLDRPLADICAKAQLLDLMRNFVIFDDGVKKVSRQHPIRRRQGGAGARPPARGRRHLAHAGQR
jgi:type I restriction enzyme, R subunit